jgi:SSS family solute:Na+ symporter
LTTLNRGRTISIPDITLGTVDLAIVAVYFMVVFAIGFRMARRTRSAEDRFLAGRRLG